MTRARYLLARVSHDKTRLLSFPFLSSPQVFWLRSEVVCHSLCACAELFVVYIVVCPFAKSTLLT